MISKQTNVYGIVQSPYEYYFIEGSGLKLNKEKQEFKLTADNEKMLKFNIKIGVLKELHCKKLLTDEQLQSLLVKYNNYLYRGV